MGEVAGETLEPRVAAELGEARERFSLERKALGLLVGDHLQPMFDATQVCIGPSEIVDRFRADPFVGAESLQHLKGARAAHLRAASAKNKLLRLDEELDLANAAASKFDIVAGHDDMVVAAHGVDLALHRVDVGNCRIIEILAPDERREVAQETLAKLEVARRRAGFDQRRTLPVLTHSLVILIGAHGRERDRSRGRIGPQPQIDPQHIALARPLLKQARQRLGQTHEQWPGLGSLRNRCRRGVEKDNEVDVARIIEFARAMLAERQHDEAGAVLQIGSVWVERQKSRACVLAQQKSQRRADRGVGETGQRLSCCDNVPNAANVRKSDQERGFALGATQRGHEIRLVLVAS
jgi:hypothetical protein